MTGLKFVARKPTKTHRPGGLPPGRTGTILLAVLALGLASCGPETDPQANCPDLSILTPAGSFEPGVDTARLHQEQLDTSNEPEAIRAVAGEIREDHDSVSTASVANYIVALQCRNINKDSELSAKEKYDALERFAHVVDLALGDPISP